MNISVRWNKKIFAIFILTFIYKLSMEWVYWNYQANAFGYGKEFSIWKYLNGMFWCFTLFLLLKHNEKKASSFLMYLKYLVEIIPITVIYALGGGNELYYNTLCLAFALCEILLFVSFTLKFKKYIDVNRWIILVFGVIVFAFMAYVVVRNGLPSLMALDIYAVYELRSSGAFSLNKYAGYLLPVIIAVFLPIMETKGICERKYSLTIIGVIVTFLLYLYSGMKAYLFSIPMVIVVTIWSCRKEFYTVFYSLLMLGLSGVMLLRENLGIVDTLYDMFVRRVMLLSANNKFLYYDFFSNNPRIGIAGIFPRWIIDIEYPYEKGIGYIISEIYYNKPEMNSNTGAFAEGYMRFGILGIFLVLILLAVIMKLIDRLQENTSYEFALGSTVYMIFILSDGHIIDSLFFGNWMFMIAFLILVGPRFIKQDYRRQKNFKKYRLNGDGGYYEA